MTLPTISTNFVKPNGCSTSNNQCLSGCCIDKQCVDKSQCAPVKAPRISRIRFPRVRSVRSYRRSSSSSGDSGVDTPDVDSNTAELETWIIVLSACATGIPFLCTICYYLIKCAEN